MPSATGSLLTGSLVAHVQDVVIPLLMDITTRKPGPLKRFLHLAGSGLWMCIAVLAVIGSVYDLATRADALRFFENASA